MKKLLFLFVTFLSLSCLAQVAVRTQDGFSTNQTLVSAVITSANGSGVTNIPYTKVISSTNGYFTATVNTDGSTNYVFVLTNVTFFATKGYTGSVTNEFSTFTNKMYFLNGVLTNVIKLP